MPIKDPVKRKEYQTKYHREIWYPANRRRRMALTIANKKKIHQKITEIKVKKGCVDCGYNKHSEALDFDHLGKKLFNISLAKTMGYSWERILEEIEKCEVVCANCHRVRTANRRSKRAPVV